MGQSALSLVGIANSRYKSSLLNERAECMTSLPYTNRSPLLLSQSFLVISYTISSPCSILSVPSNFLLFCFIWLVTLPPHPPPLKLRAFLDEFVSKFIKKTLQNSLSDLKEFEGFIKRDTLANTLDPKSVLLRCYKNNLAVIGFILCVPQKIINLCCFVVIKIIWLLLGLYFLCPRK